MFLEECFTTAKTNDEAKVQIINYFSGARSVPIEEKTTFDFDELMELIEFIKDIEFNTKEPFIYKNGIVKFMYDF